MEAQNAKVGRKYQSFSSQITVNNLRMYAQDIANWTLAINAARNKFSPRRRLLYELYDNITIDGHLLAVMNKRVTNILNKKIIWVQKDGNENITNQINETVLHTEWFNDLVKYTMEAVPYGHSLIELIPENGKIAKAALINRANVRPEYGFVMWNFYVQNTGIYYREDPVYADYLFEVGKKYDYGLLMTAAQYVIYKRGGFGDWAQFAELFGMPFRVGKYNMYDDVTRQKLSEALTTMGGAGYAVIPDGTSLEFHDTNGSGKSEVYKDLIGICNEEISKIFLGNTMTTENGSSYGQSEVHKDVEEEICTSDIIHIEKQFNQELKAKLIKLGYPLENGEFQFDKTNVIKLQERILIDMQVATKVPVGAEYWYKTYGIEKPEESEIIEPIDDTEHDETDTNKNPNVPPLPGGPNNSLNKPVKKKSPVILNLDYSGCNCGDPTHKHTVTVVNEFDNDINRIVKGMYDGTVKRGTIDPKLHLNVAEGLFKQVKEGFGKVGTGYAAPDANMLFYMRNNAFKFSAAKNFNQMREMYSSMTKDGKIVPFNEFKKGAIAVNTKYMDWLQTEYDTAKGTARMASNYNGYLKTKDIFDLQYNTAGDANVRPEHQRLEGITRPADDAFWNTYLPPNDWNCRCDVRQVAKGTATTQDLTGLPRLPKEFKGNPATDGVIFNDANSYFQTKDVNKMQAVKDYGMQTIKDIYVDANKLAKYKGSIDTSNDLQHWWLGMQQTDNELKGGFVVKSKLGDKIGFDVDFKNKILNKENRFKYADEIQNILNNPDEVFYKKEQGIDKNIYIKYYHDAPLILVAANADKKGLKALTFYKVENDIEGKMGKKRIGTLLDKK